VTAPSTKQTATIFHDIPCINCGYNLRGLDAEGHCPECGQEIAQSVRWWKLQERDAPALLTSNPRWVREISEGLLVALMVFLLAAALALAPGWTFEWKSPQRGVALGVACTAWILSCWAAWKLGRREPVDAPTGERSRRLLRFGALAYVVGPFIAGLAPRYNATWQWVLPSLICLVGGLIAGGAWFVYAGHLAARAGARIVYWEANAY
jgi:hypothetical protein